MFWFYWNKLSFIEYVGEAALFCIQKQKNNMLLFLFSYQFYALGNIKLGPFFLLIVILFGLSSLVPAVFALKVNEKFVTAASVAHSMVLLLVEYVLSNERVKHGKQVEISMYPSYLILLTSISALLVYYRCDLCIISRRKSLTSKILGSTPQIEYRRMRFGYCQAYLSRKCA